jgi:ATP-dependent RNA helicase SUPV3L1/SUV3
MRWFQPGDNSGSVPSPSVPEHPPFASHPFMSLFSLRRNAPQSPSNEPAAAPGAGAPAAAPSVHPLDAVTGGAFSAATSGERAARVRAWLQTEPGWETMNEVFKELSQRDRGAAKPLKEKLDELRRQKAQEHIGVEWAQKARTLIDQPRLNLADAMAWQRDAARAGAPLSRDPLAGLKAALADRVKAIEDLQHRVQVERESAVLMAQRIEILSTKSWKEAQLALDGLRSDVQQWQQLVAGLSDDPQWPSVEPRFPPMLEASRQQLQLVWDAFEAALAQAVAADADVQAPLPAVPVWAEELRQARGPEKSVEADNTTDVHQAERRAKAQADMGRALSVLEREVAQGHGKATPKAAHDVRSLLRSAGRLLGADLEARAHAVLVQAGELEDWQRWRADQLREELVGKAEALLSAPEGQRLGGRKMQETLRSLREQWKTTDQGGQANHALWKRFDEACTRAHKEVEVWLAQVRQQAESHRAQRLALIEEVKAWTSAHAGQGDWKHQIRDLHAFSERWREAGHLSEKAFAELQPLWKEAMRAAHGELEAAQAQSLARRRAMIDEAVALGQAPQLHIDAVKTLQQRWQAEAHAVPLDRKQEQKLWEAFRQPIDEAFQRKSTERVKVAAALSAHDQQVLDAARSLEAASATGDAQQIRAAQQALEQAIRGEPAFDGTPTTPDAAPRQSSEPALSSEPSPAADTPTAPPPARKLVAMRGDDRPGMKKAEPPGRDERRAPSHRDGRGPRDAGRGGREPRATSAPRLGDAAFRAQRQALEHAELALRKLAAQAHGEVLTQLLTAWEQRDPAQMPSAQALGRAAAAARSAWGQALGRAPADGSRAESLLRLEMAAEVPSPAEYIEARRQLQLQLLTRRHEAAPAETWLQDVAQVLAAAFEPGAARRLQQVLKVLLRR